MEFKSEAESNVFHILLNQISCNFIVAGMKNSYLARTYYEYLYGPSTLVEMNIERNELSQNDLDSGIVVRIRHIYQTSIFCSRFTDTVFKHMLLSVSEGMKTC